MTPTPTQKQLKFDEAVDPEYFLYFAYGSNLLTERIHVNNPSAEYVGVGRLDGYTLGFSGDSLSSRWKGAGATIFSNTTPDAHVYGVVWRLHTDHSDSLDLQESCYRRLTVDVQVRGDEGDLATLSCRTYQMLLPTDDNVSTNSSFVLPSPHYKHVIVSGAEEHNLPNAYIDFLKSLPDNGYTGSIGVSLKILAEFSLA